MVCPLLKKSSCKKIKKVCKQNYSIKMINHKNCKVFGGKIKGKAAKKIKKAAKVRKAGKTKGKRKKGKR